MTEDPHPPTYPSGIPRPTTHARGDGAEVLVLTGMSGAGRTRAAAVLADLGWYVVDNLPPHLMGDLVDSLLGRESTRKLRWWSTPAAAPSLRTLIRWWRSLEQRGVQVRIVFLDASDETLVRRFEEARRPHPLQGDGTLLEGIRKEREIVAGTRRTADHVIDTSRLNVHQLREVITAEIAAQVPQLQVNVQSFGFKNGIPVDADFVADVRFLANPHWDPALRPLTGLDAPVRDHVLHGLGAEEFLDGYTAVLDGALQRYRAHDKPSVTVGVGCTGASIARSRSPRSLGRRLQERGYAVRISHRDRTLG
ncbi:RNase adapter RapZ [Demequina litorisediminis]|uniref:Nucleotide-binding protein n=1 Tax=Demequina litorisediminis TaxID=1849022 RepID=A0ABQ6IJB5_9MICO|nr:RNase adapter RapZ [Demequina litorisediminis]GMA37491.1 nucleotide-binding protein [Demequina litorisediminis]